MLFGGLIARLEDVIREDGGLREGLAEQRRKLTRRAERPTERPRLVQYL